MGLAIKVTDCSYPLIIQDAIEAWNNGSDSRKVVMSFDKSNDNWKRDYESEILLGGCTPVDDFAYVGLAKVEAQVTSTRLGGLLGQITAGTRLRKVNAPL